MQVPHFFIEKLEHAVTHIFIVSQRLVSNGMLSSATEF